MDEILNESKKVWDDFTRVHKKQLLQYPDECYIRIFSGKYVDIPKAPAKLLDHGFGSGNSFPFFLEKGYDVYGCEVVQSLIDVAKENFVFTDKKIEFSLIQGTKLDYEDNYFDVIVSWNTLHYNGTKEAVKEVISEFRRILKPGGILILSTIHPSNSVAKRGVDQGDGSLLIEKPSKFDNRKGLTLFCPSSKDDFQSLWSNFSEIKFGHYNYNFFNKNYEHAARLVYAKK